MTAPTPEAARERVRAAGAAIRRAFADTSYPGDRDIGRRSAEVAWEHNLEPKQIEAFFAGKTWPEITLRALQDYVGDEAACLSFMTPAAFRHYLPAYMLMVLEEFGAASGLVDSLLARLTPQDRVPGPKVYHADPFFERVAPLTVPEREAVAQFLLALLLAYSEAWLPSDSPAIPLHLFWGQYLSETDRVLIPPLPRDEIEASRHELVEFMRRHRTAGDV